MTASELRPGDRFRPAALPDGPVYIVDGRSEEGAIVHAKAEDGSHRLSIGFSWEVQRLPRREVVG